MELKMKLKNKDDEIQNAKVEMNILERKILVLNEEVVLLRKKTEEANILLQKRENGAFPWSKMLFFLVLFCIMFGYFK